MFAFPRLFENYFDTKEITSVRLAAFAQDALTKLKTETGAPFVDLAAALTPPLAALQAEIGEVDVSLLGQKSSTQTADEFQESFGAEVKKWELTIAAALEGRESIGYKQFFPATVREYTHAPKKNMPVLTQRLGVLAAAYAAKLPADLVTAFTGYEATWKNLSESQSSSRKSTTENRDDRSKARKGVELALLRALHTIAAAYAGNESKGNTYFNFNLLQADHYASLQKEAKPAQS